MIVPSRLVLWFISLVRLIYGVSVVSTEESGGRDFLASLNENSAELASKLVRAQWVFETNNTENAKNELVRLTSEAIKNVRVRFQKVLSVYPWQSFSNPDVRRQLKFFSEIGTLALSDEEYNQFEKIVSDLDVIQQNTTICDYYNKIKCDLRYSDLKEKMETSRDSGELSYLWTEWRKATQSELNKLLESYVKLCNQAALLNNYRNYKEYSLRNIQSDDIRKEMTALWEDIRPLYSQIHAYVRRKLRDLYGEDIVPRKGPIPTYLLGDIWSEKWSGRWMVPYPDQDNFNFTTAMISQGFTAEGVQEAAEDFLVSMNFSVPSNLWVDASETSADPKVEICHSKIFNFYDDFVRIKDCKKTSFKQYLEDIRLLTKAEYILQYKDQPYIYQTSADPGLEEAMSNVMTMSASTFDNVKRLGLYKGELTEEIRLNRLFKLALDKLTSLTFLLVQEFWRWDVYGGRSLEDTANTLNDLREKFQGISTFTKELTFAPRGIGSAFSKLSLSHHFLGNFLEFQLYESLCKMSTDPQQENDPTECNLYENVEAGEALRKMMKLGSSKPLTETFSTVLGISKINSKSILKFFQPLMKWLEKENKRTGEFIGWEPEQPKSDEAPAKIRRKRSLDDYPSELKDEDSNITPSREPDRFQRLIHKRSKNNQDNPETNIKERKNAGYYQNKDTVTDGLVDEQRPGRNAEESTGRSFSTKNRRTSTTKHKNNNKHSRQISVEDKQVGDNSQELKKLNPRNVKRHSGFEVLEKTYINTREHDSNAGESAHEKRSYEFGGDADKDIKSNLASKDSSYEAVMDYSRMKSADDRGDASEDKGANKLWSLKSYLTENANVMSPGSSMEKKEGLTSTLMAHAVEEKSIGKKETSRNEPSVTSGNEMVSETADRRFMQGSESGVKRLNIDVPSLQALLQKADMNAYQPRQVYSVNPVMSENTKNEMSPMYSQSKTNPNSKYANYFFKYAPPADTMQYKEKKEFRDGDMDSKGKSPYIIIVGQSPPDMKEKFQDKEVNFREVDKQSLQGGSSAGEKKMSDKRSRASDQIFIVPIDLKSTQHNLIKTNHYTEYEHEAGHDPNTERDQETEQHLEDNSKMDENSNFYKAGRESPSEFIISWNNDKNRKIVKRSKREHKKDASDDKMKVVRIAPMKDSFLEGLLGKSLDRANLDDKNVKILIHDGQLSGNAELASGMSSPSPNGAAGPLSEMGQTSSLHQSPSSLTSFASNVLSALSPKSFTQLVKATNQHQDLDLEEENLKESGNTQTFVGKKKAAKLHSEDDVRSLMDVDQAAKGDDQCCKKIVLTPCPPRCQSSSCPCPLPCPCPCPCPPPPCPDDCCRKVEATPICCKPECPDLCCKKPSECSLVNCQFKITKAKKPHERLTIMIYDRINPPAELPEPYDALAVISEILQRIQCCSCKPSCQLTEEDPDYPANDNSDQLKGNPNPSQDKSKVHELSGEIPILGGDSAEDDDSDENSQLQQMQNSPSSVEEDKYQPKEKATPALDQLTVFNKDKLKPVFFELRKIDDLIKKRSQKE